MSFFDDPNFVDELIVLVVHDRSFLRDHSHILSLDDFAPTVNTAPTERWYTAGIALEFWKTYQHPVGRYLRTQVMDFCKERNLSERATKSLQAYTDKIIRMARTPVATEAVSERLKKFKSEKAMWDATGRIMDAMKNHTLTVDFWQEITHAAVEQSNGDGETVIDYFEGAEDRIARRKEFISARLHPRLMIDQYDERFRGISFGHMGVIMAPYGRGKSLMFSHISVAYALQDLNVLFFTLEDKLSDVEDRLDASITHIPVLYLKHYESQFRARFNYYRRLIRSKIKVVDGTDGGMTIARIEAIFEREKNNGFRADAILVDYDDEIQPARHNRDGKRYEEFKEIYRDFRGVLARTQSIGWTASQSGRGTENLKVIGGKHVADDIGKMRKATQVISLGQGEWGEDSTYLWLEKNRIGAQHWGFNIMQDKASLVFYDRDKTLEMEANQAEDANLMSEADNLE
jgi:hypothetical protein